jgi:hypothetical protein
MYPNRLAWIGTNAQGSTYKGSMANSQLATDASWNPDFILIAGYQPGILRDYT